MPGRYSAVIVLIFALLSPSVVQSAAAAMTSLTVHVVDESGKPIWLARVTIKGPAFLIAESNRKGDAVFPEIPSGFYRLTIVRAYFIPLINKPAILPAKGLVVTERLARFLPKQIAEVTAKPKQKPNENTVGEDSTAAQIGDSLISAIQSLPGVSIDGNGQASISGYSPNQTTLEINGVPISLPGSAQSLTTFNASVFSNASVSPGAGGGGVVSFETRSPTLAWQGVARAVLASNHGEDVALQEEGTIGQIGVSYSHARNVVSDPLDGKTFLDTSGLDYSHDASASVNADALQVRYEFSQANTLLATVVSLDSSIPMVCRTWTGTLPCGFGPTNVQNQNLQTAQLTDFAQLGLSTLSFTLYANHITDDVDQSGYYVAGVNEPSDSLTDSHEIGTISNLQIHAGKVILPLSLNTRSVSSASSGSAFGPLFPAVLAHYSSLQASTSLPLVRGSRLNAGIGLSLQSQATLGVRTTRSNGVLYASYRATAHDSLSASYSPGSLSGPSVGFSGISAPAFLQFVCGQRVGIGSGPTTAGQQATQTSGNISWMHDATRWSAQASVYRNIQYNAPISAIVNAQALDPAYFSGDYLAQAQQAYGSACGNSTPLALSNLYFRIAGVADRAEYDGIKLNASGQIGERSRVSVAYATTLARAYGSDPVLFGPQSTVIEGSQLPNAAMHQINASLSQAIGSGIAALLQATYQGRNNSSNLPAYTTYDAGILVRAPRGMLSVTMTNIGNVFPGPFANSVDAVPLPTNGGTFPTIAQPLLSRTLRVGYRFTVGLPERQTTFDIPHDQFTRPSTIMTFYAGGPFEVGPPRDPFGIDRQSVSCGPKDVVAAEKFIRVWQDYVQGIEDAKVHGAYPITFPPLEAGVVELHYQRNGSSYVVRLSSGDRITPALMAQLQPFLNCANMHSGNALEVKERNLFAPVYSPKTVFQDNMPMYAPEVGFYHPDFVAHGTIIVPPVPDNLKYTGLSPLCRLTSHLH